MVAKITKKDFLENLIKLGAKRIGYVPLSVQRDKAMLKVSLLEDPNILLFISEKLHTQENLWNTHPNKRHLLLEMKNLKDKIPAKMIEWMVDEKTSIVGMPFFHSEFTQFKDFTYSAKSKLVASFLIEKRRIPDYLEDFALEYKDMSIDELKVFKSNLILMESLGKIIDKECKDNSLKQNNVVGNDFYFGNKL